MYRPYHDLREKLGEPLWHDDQGVPRYAAFQPSACGVYDQYVALLDVACQACGQSFLVSDSTSDEAHPPKFPTREDAGDFGYGDAPWHDEGRCAGITMNTVTRRVVEFWTKDGGPYKSDWRRRPQYEFTYDPAPGVYDPGT